MASVCFSNRLLISTTAAVCAIAMTGAAFAESDCRRCDERVVVLDRLHRFHVTSLGEVLEDHPLPPAGGATRQDCTFVVSHSDASFEGGSYLVQAGFVENEIAIAVHDVPASAYPIKIDLMEMIFATSGALAQTTTEYSVLVWDGLPDSTPDYIFSSDGTIIPHLVLPPGTNGANIAFSIDPGDPDQLFLTNANGANKFSIGYRVDQHNSQSGNGCLSPPQPEFNAFPVVDTSGVATSTGNWLFAIDCGFIGCTPGFNPFNQIFDPFGGPCNPSGDWVLRATWTSINCTPTPDEGACCLTDGTCEFTTPDDCAAQGGTYQGNDTLCADVICPLPTVACCFSQTSCIQLTVDNCIAAGGTPGPLGSQCGSFICFPTGACCLPDGSCQDELSPEDCDLLGGVFQGANTSCVQITCPLPTGACCFPNGFCLDAITEADCLSADGVWGGFDSICVDDNNDGVFENCAPGCVGDISGDGLVDGADLNIMLTNWGCPNPADNCQNSDLTADLNVDGADLNVLLSDWGCSG